jgi:hypothetical protein
MTRHAAQPPAAPDGAREVRGPSGLVRCLLRNAPRVFLPIRVRGRGSVNSYNYSIARLVSGSLGAGDPVEANA